MKNRKQFFLFVSIFISNFNQKMFIVTKCIFRVFLFHFFHFMVTFCMMLHHCYSDIEPFHCLYSIPRTHINVNKTFFCFLLPFFTSWHDNHSTTLLRSISTVARYQWKRLQNHYILMYVNPLNQCRFFICLTNQIVYTDIRYRA